MAGGIIITMDMPATSDVGALHRLHRGCFACGADNPRGLQLEFRVQADGRAVADWQPRAEWTSYAGRVHGGVIATLLDCAMVHALFARRVAGLTAEFTIRYPHPMNASQPVRLCAWVESQCRALYLCRAEARQHGQVVAHAAAKFLTAKG